MSAERGLNAMPSSYSTTRRLTAVSWFSEEHGVVRFWHSRLGVMLWAVVLPAATALTATVAALFALEDTQYSTATILSIYVVLMPGVAVRNHRALRAP
jgi:hypothetical protein